MNILPKKRWHVRNRENIARVRKDEAAAAEEEKEKERRRFVAEQEAKIQLMRQHVQQKYDLPKTTVEPKIEKSVDVVSEHVNFFKDLEEGAAGTNAKNKDHEQELKEEKEKYEKQIGYLTYLGQDTNEATGNVSWYNKPRPQLSDIKDEESDVKGKSRLDPICTYKHLFQRQQFPSNEKSVQKSSSTAVTSSKKKKHKHKLKHQKRRHSFSDESSSSSSSDNEKSRIAKIQQLRLLREQRLKREREEKLRADKILAKLRGDVIEPVKEPSPAPYVQKYNSQFNPQLARQNAAK